MITILVTVLFLGLLTIFIAWRWKIVSILKTKKTCKANCVNKTCKQDDGCGQSCKCPDDQKCTSEGSCISNICIPSCDGKTCGPDKCGGTCGKCNDEEICNGFSKCEAIPIAESKFKIEYSDVISPNKLLDEGKYLILGPNETWLTAPQLIFEKLSYQNPASIWTFKDGKLIASDGKMLYWDSNKLQISLETDGNKWVLREGSIMNWIFFIGVSDEKLFGEINPCSNFFRCRPVKIHNPLS